jgi:hypothetical protein
MGKKGKHFMFPMQEMGVDSSALILKNILINDCLSSKAQLLEPYEYKDFESSCTHPSFT